MPDTTTPTTTTSAFQSGNSSQSDKLTLSPYVYFNCHRHDPARDTRESNQQYAKGTILAEVVTFVTPSSMENLDGELVNRSHDYAVSFAKAMEPSLRSMAKSTNVDKTDASKMWSIYRDAVEAARDATDDRYQELKQSASSVQINPCGAEHVPRSTFCDLVKRAHTDIYPLPDCELVYGGPATGVTEDCPEILPRRTFAQQTETDDTKTVKA